MSAKTVGIGELKTSNTIGDILRVYGLGSCVGVAAMAPRLRAVALLHIALPESKINLGLAQDQPGMFADTGIPFLLEEMGKYGCRPQELIIKIAGGAAVLEVGDSFEIGKRNILAVKKILWRFRMGPVAEDVGETYSRTMSVDVENGWVVLSSPRKGEWHL